MSSQALQDRISEQQGLTTVAGQWIDPVEVPRHHGLAPLCLSTLHPMLSDSETPRQVLGPTSLTHGVKTTELYLLKCFYAMFTISHLRRFWMKLMKRSR